MVHKSVRVKNLFKFHLISERVCFSSDLELITVKNKTIHNL